MKKLILIIVIAFFSCKTEKKSDASALYNSAISKAYIYDYEGAIADYTKATELDPNYFQAYYNRGIVKGKLKDYYGAIQDNSKAIEFNPDYAKAYNNRGNEKVNLKDYYGAIADYNKAINLDPENAGNYYGIALAKGKLGAYKYAGCQEAKIAQRLGYNTDDAIYLVDILCPNDVTTSQIILEALNTADY